MYILFGNCEVVPSQSTSHAFEPSPTLVSITEVNTRVPFSESAHSRRVKMRSTLMFSRIATTREPVM